MNSFASFESTAPARTRLFKGTPVKLSGLFAVAIALSACIGQGDSDADDGEVTQEQQQAVTSRPPCTAANEGAQITETVRGGYNVYRCESGTWEIFLSCRNGVCVGY
ncbi:MAG: hypothetical protein QM820_39190 [Minicystis sp.]